VYRAYCLACHDADGRGQTARKAMPDLPDFTDAKWQTTRTDADFKQSILEGKGKFMLPMKGKLTPVEVDQSVAYIRGFREGKQVVQLEPQAPLVPPPPAQPAVVEAPKPVGPVVRFPGTSPERKKAVPAAETAETAARLRIATGMYRQYCLTCHGADGRGQEMKASMPTMPDFTNRGWQEGVNNPQLMLSILDGKGTLMPAFRGRVAEDQAQDLVAYVRAFGPLRITQPEAAAGDFEERFRELRDQWYELQRQLEELSKQPPPKK
jgi:mono/diheme cytochrome c family protein